MQTAVIVQEGKHVLVKADLVVIEKRVREMIGVFEDKLFVINASTV